MYKRSNFHQRRPFLVPNRAFDSFSSLGYEYNAAGFIRNDFSQLNERENELGFLRALSQMRDYSELDSNKGKTFEQIVSEIRPRWCQLPGEVDRFEQYCIDNALDYYKRLKDAETKEGAVAADVANGVGVKPTSEPAVVGSPA